MILVIGASGFLGKTTSTILCNEGYKVKAASRSPMKLSGEVPSSVSIVKADLTDPTTLAPAMEGVDTIVAAAHSLLGRGKNSSAAVDELGVKTLIDTAKAKGVKHFIYISIYGASPSNPSAFIRRKYEMEQYLINSGVPYSIIRPSAFMEVHAHELFGKGILSNGKALIFGKGDKPFNYVAVRDVAALISMVVKNGPLNGVTNVGGPDNANKLELAKIYERLTGKPVKLSHVPVAVLKIVSKISKPFHAGISAVTEMSLAMDEMDMSMDMAPVLARFPISQTTLEEFVAEKCEMADHLHL